MASLDLSKHISCTTSPYIKEICTYLFDKLKVEYFNFVRQFTDGTEFTLTTDPQWTQIFFDNKLYTNLLIDKNHVGNENLINQVKILPWNLYAHSYVLSVQKDFSGICAGITILFIRENFTDFFHFGTSIKNYHMQKFYANNADALINFCFQFKEKANDIIALSKHKKNRLSLYEEDCLNSKTIIDENTNELSTINIEEIHKNFMPNKYFFDKGDEAVVLSRKEILCLQGICAGKSSSMLAKEVFLSKRTMDGYIEKLKEKFKVATKKDLIELCIKDYIQILNYLDSK